MTTTTVDHVTINTVDGDQVRFDEDDQLIAPDGEPLALELVPDILSIPGGYIEYETQARLEYGEGVEEWQVETGDWQPARVRLFGRAVASVMVVRDG